MKMSVKKISLIFKLYHAYFLFTAVCLLLITPSTVKAQISISSTTAVTENFDAIGSTAPSSLPSNWLMSPSATSAPTWTDPGNFSSTNFAVSAGAPVTGGRYNWGKTGGTDRSIGFITSFGTYPSPNSIMAWYRNAGSDLITSLTVSYDLYQFRINTATTSVTFFYSTDGTTWTAVSAGDAQTITTGASAYNFSTPANYGRSSSAGSAAFTISGLSVAVGGDIYLRWNFKTVGSSSSHGLGLDNVSVAATFCTLVNPTGFAAATGNGRLTLSWANPPCFDEILVVAATHSSIISVPSGDGSSYTANSVYASVNSGNNLAVNEFAVYKSTGASVLVTGLNNNTIYYFKVFARRGTSWTSGITCNGTPIAPFTGDFRSIASGNWTNNNIWEKYSGGAWVSCASNEWPNYKTSNVIIQSGNVVKFNGAGPYAVNSLTVQSSGKVYTNGASGTSTNYISVYGNITCDGVIGNYPSYDDIGFTIESSSCTISGSGTFACSRIRKQWTTTSTDLTINMNVTTLWNILSTTQLYNYSTGTFNITISAGVTFTCTNTGNTAIDGVNGLDAEERKGSLNVYGTLTIPGILYLTTNNSGANSVAVNIFNGGIINTASVIASASGSATHTLHIYNGGKLNITSAAGWSSFSTTNNNYILDAGSTIEYSYIGNQTIETGVGNYSNLTCSGGGVKTPNSNLIVDGTLSISAGTLSIGSNTLTLNGSITGSGTLTGSSTSDLTLGGSGSSIGTLNFTAGAQTLDLLTVNRNATGQFPAAILGSSLAVNSIALSEGILATGYNLLTWNNSGGTLNAPESSYTPTSLNYTKSFVATCDDSGTPINVADATTAFTGNAGFQIKNVGNSNTYFPVGASYLPAMTGQVASPNRMMINNLSSTTHDFTVIVNYGDIGYTNGSAGTLRVNRIWYVNRSGSNADDSATMQLFFTKRDWTGWGTTENEVEQGFSYFQPSLVQKDYSGNGASFINLSSGSDVHDFSSGGTYPLNTEVYGLYTVNISNNASNGIQQFNRFSVVNAGDIVLPINIINFKAYLKNDALEISWTALNETNIGHYEVQRSKNGKDFTSIASVSANNTGGSANYSKTDETASTGNNFYRVKVIDKNGKISYTLIINVPFSSDKTGIDIYPNPIVNSWCVVRINNLAKGKYNLLLYAADGKPVLSKTIEHDGGTTSQTILLPSSTSPGKYFIRIANGEIRYTKSVLISKF